MKRKEAEGLGVDGRKELEYILKNYVSIRGIRLILFTIGITGEPYEREIEPPGSEELELTYYITTKYYIIINKKNNADI